MSNPRTARSSSRRSVLKFAAVGALSVPVVAVASCSTSDGKDEATPTAAANPSAETNKALVVKMFDEFYGQGRTNQADRYFSADYIEHDPAIASGRAGIVAWVEQQRATSPRPVATVKRVLAQGSLVAVHSHRSTTPSDEMTGTAAIELFDVRGGKIVEHWTYTQAVPAKTASGNSMFSDVYKYPGTAPTISATQADANKQLILKAWAAVYTARDFTVLDRYWALDDGYLQHNPNVPNGVGGLRGFLGGLPPSLSQNRFALGSGDLVLTVNQSVPTSGDLNSDNVGSAVADIYRIVGGRAVEHWDIVSQVPTTTANGNSVFSRLFDQ